MGFFIVHPEHRGQGFGRQLWAARRDRLIAWLQTPAVIGKDGVLQGYGVVRSCRKGFQIGPLSAADAETAEAIYRGLSDHARDVPLFVDVPASNLESLRPGCTAPSATRRVRRRKNP